MVGWYEIPVENMDRAKGFYETVFKIEISIHDLGGFLMGWLPESQTKGIASGSLVKHETYQPSATHGPLIYFSSEDVNNELGRVEEAGGAILQPKTEIGGGHGFMALIRDSEGNRIALHSQA